MALYGTEIIIAQMSRVKLDMMHDEYRVFQDISLTVMLSIT